MTLTSLRHSNVGNRLLVLLSVVGLVLAATLVSGPAAVEASSPTCSVSWTGGGNNDLWSNAANWNTHTVPGSSSNVCITSLNLIFVSAVGTQSIHSLQIGGSSDTLILGSSNKTDTMTVGAGVTNSGTLELDQASLTAGQITNPGSVDSVQGGRITSKALSSTGSIAAETGTLTLTDLPLNFSGGTLTGGQWSTSSFGSLALPGSVSTLDALVTVGGGPITNSATGANALAGLTTIDPGAQFAVDGSTAQSISGTLTNRGTVVLGGYDSPGTLTISGNYTQLAGGYTTLTDGTLTTPQANIASGSTLELGAATLAGNLQNSGFVSGTSGQITGNFTQTSTGTIQVSFSGTFPIGGSATLAGALQVYVLFPPAPGTVATVMTFASSTGSFASVQVGFQATVSSTHVDVVANPAITVTPGNVAPGQTVTVAGGDFGEDDLVTLTLGSVPLGTVTAGLNGSFTTTVTIPTTTAPGTYTMTATGTSGLTAQSSLQVT